MIAAYIRVSSRAQDVATQRAAIERAAAARGDSIDRWFQEQRSAATLDRPELAAVREAARRGELSRLYVFRLDRLARSGIRDTLGLIQELRGAGVQLVNLADGFQLENSGLVAEVVLAVMAWAAQMERAALGERIAAARVRVEASGGSWGRPVVLTEELRSQIFSRRERGDSVREIAVAMKLKKSTVARWLVSQKPPSDGDKFGSKKAAAKKK